VCRRRTITRKADRAAGSETRVCPERRNIASRCCRRQAMSAALPKPSLLTAESGRRYGLGADIAPVRASRILCGASSTEEANVLEDGFQRACVLRSSALARVRQGALPGCRHLGRLLQHVPVVQVETREPRREAARYTLQCRSWSPDCLPGRQPPPKRCDRIARWMGEPSPPRPGGRVHVDASTNSQAHLVRRRLRGYYRWPCRAK
jgi:hypothetical protein